MIRGALPKPVTDQNTSPRTVTSPRSGNNKVKIEELFGKLGGIVCKVNEKIHNFVFPTLEQKFEALKLEWEDKLSKWHIKDQEIKFAHPISGKIERHNLTKAFYNAIPDSIKHDKTFTQQAIRMGFDFRDFPTIENYDREFLLELLKDCQHHGVVFFASVNQEFKEKFQGDKNLILSFFDITKGLPWEVGLPLFTKEELAKFTNPDTVVLIEKYKDNINKINEFSLVELISEDLSKYAELMDLKIEYAESDDQIESFISKLSAVKGECLALYDSKKLEDNKLIEIAKLLPLKQKEILEKALQKKLATTDWETDDGRSKVFWRDLLDIITQEIHSVGVRNFRIKGDAQFYFP